MFFNNASKQLNKIYTRLGYPEVPFLPSNSECKRIIESYRNFPANLVPKEYMVRDTDSLLRGDYIILWWLTLKDQDVTMYPQYFLYTYGINFEKELSLLKTKNLVTKNNKLSMEGRKLLDNNSEYIKMHRANKIYSPNGGPVKYESIEDINPNKIVRKPKDLTNESKMDDYFFAEEQRLERLWQLGEIDRVEKLGNKLISEGIMYPAVFNRMAILYRKQKNYDKEIETLELAIQRQIEFHNTGVAAKRFTERLDRAKELKQKYS